MEGNKRQGKAVRENKYEVKVKAKHKKSKWKTKKEMTKKEEREW